ncbi:hypothetical protein F0562_023303 [Nyssa sinensis]|uniref:C3H1-type domain-containing protein n=1 Tax=Nyssa sinensis TaxID=561372 RepID=A0A5J5BM31_9ASTE|nr:hypothetical protein F0562_023303 [Nyssa sinensis]
MAGNWPVVRPALNNSRYPLRPGETKCWYFLKTGECNFDITCKFHHPQSACVQVAAPTLVPAQSLFGPSSQQYEIRMELKVLMELLVQFPSFLHPKK